jgi:hypothetical protein
VARRRQYSGGIKAKVLQAKRRSIPNRQKHVWELKTVACLAAPATAASSATEPPAVAPW